MSTLLDEPTPLTSVIDQFDEHETLVNQIRVAKRRLWT